MSMRKKICNGCGKMVDENHKCEVKRLKYNENKRKYAKQNKDTQSELTTVRWRKFRLNIISRDNHLCQRCLIKYQIINAGELQVHHIKPRIFFPELMYDENNVITTCKTCNIQLGLEGIDFEWTPPKQEEYNL